MARAFNANDANVEMSNDANGIPRGHFSPNCQKSMEMAQPQIILHSQALSTSIEHCPSSQGTRTLQGLLGGASTARAKDADLLV